MTFKGLKNTWILEKRKSYWPPIWKLSNNNVSTKLTCQLNGTQLLHSYICVTFHEGAFIHVMWYRVIEGNGNPLQYSCLENPMDRGAWWAAVHGITKSQSRLSNVTFTFHFHASEKAMATHSSTLAWRIPGMEKLGGLPSMGSHRVGHDWSDLAAAAAAAAATAAVLNQP